MTYTLGELVATEEQAEIIDFALANPKRHILINALAGAAKTSTLRFLAKYLPTEPTLSVAFNKRIADEMSKVLPGHVRCATMNSVGHRVWAAATGRKLVLDTKKTYNLVREAIDQLPKRQQGEAWNIFSDLTKTVSRAKLNGYVPSSLQGAKTLLTAEEFFGSLDEEPDDMVLPDHQRRARQGHRPGIRRLDRLRRPDLHAHALWGQLPRSPPREGRRGPGPQPPPARHGQQAHRARYPAHRGG